MPDQRDQEIGLAEGLVERPLLADQPVEQRRGAAAGRRHVDMRIGAVADHRGGVPYHLRRHVGVEIEAGDDRQCGTEQGADAAQQLALAILEMRRDHRAMQVEIDAVERTRGGEVLEQPRRDALIHILIDIGRGRRRAPRQRHQLMAQPAQRADRAGDRNVVAGDRLEQRRPADIAGPGIGPLEILPGRALRREGVGFVLKPADRNARHCHTLNSVSPPANAGGGPCRWSPRRPPPPRCP